MKIACLSAFYPFRGGIAQFSDCLYLALRKNHQVKAFTFKRQYPDFLFPGTTQYVEDEDLNNTIDSVEILDSINPFSYAKTARLIENYHPELLLTAFWMSFFGPSFGYVSKKLKSKTKVISVLHNVIPHEQKIIDKPFTKYFLHQNHGFVVMSNAVKNDLLELTNGRAQYMECPHPIYSHFGNKVTRNEAIKKLKLDPNKKTLLFFGMIRLYKGLDLLLEAFNQLDDSYQLVIAGESYTSFESYEDQINASPFKDHIFVFNHYINNDDVPAFFCAADVCILPYRSATQSGVTSIAYHFDLPIIATDVGGLKESVEHEKSGLIVEEPVAILIANAIRYYFDNHLQTSFANYIASDLKHSLSWDNFANKIIDFSRTLKL